MLVCSLLIGGVKSDQEFQADHFMEHVVLPDITANGGTTHLLDNLITPFCIASALLTGRCLWLAGKMSALLCAPLLVRCVHVLLVCCSCIVHVCTYVE